MKIASSYSGRFELPGVDCIETVVESELLHQFGSGTQPEYSSKPLKHSIVERILVLKMGNYTIF